jgi:hypothetical protein
MSSFLYPREPVLLPVFAGYAIRLPSKSRCWVEIDRHIHTHIVTLPCPVRRALCALVFSFIESVMMK